MKKQLIAAAVAAAVAVPAAAQVTVYGVLSSGYQALDSDVNGTILDTTTFGQQGMQSGSRLGFRGTEDLGGGMKSGFVYERGVSMTTTTDSIRQAFVSLSGGFGEVRLGRGNSLSKDVYDTFHTHGGSGFLPGNQSAAFSTLLTGTAFSILNYGNVRHSNIVSYISPSMNGLSVRAQFGQDKTTNNAGTTSAKVENAGINFSSGPISAAFAHDVTKAEAGAQATKFTTDIFGASYNLGVASLFIAHTKYKVGVTAAGSFKNTDNSVGVKAPLGKIELIASFSDGDIKAGDGKANTDGYQLGLNYNLSKRTVILARYGESEVKDSGFKATADGIGIGLQHSF